VCCESTGRDELEAVVRAQITRAVSNALTAGVPSSGILNRATEAILDAADAYAASDSEALAVLRRAVLRRETYSKERR
jgi:hypothetical protein